MARVPGSRKSRARTLANSGRVYRPGRVGSSSTRGANITPMARPEVPEQDLIELAEMFLAKGAKSTTGLAREIARHTDSQGLSEKAIKTMLLQLGADEKITLPGPSTTGGKRKPIKPEKLIAIRAYAERYPKLFDTQIARKFKVSTRTVRRARTFK